LGIIDKDTIMGYILPHLSVGKRGFKPRVCLVEVVQAIFYRLKTGCQWRELPVRQFLSGGSCWQHVYYYFNKWSKDGSWQSVWINLLRTHRSYVDLSCAQLDGSHTPAKRGGEAVGYQGRKAAKTSSSLFLCDNSGQMLSMGVPQQGQHHDLYHIRQLFADMCSLLETAGISMKGVFLNADPGFDAEELRNYCSEAEIEANIKINPRKGTSDTDEYLYFDEELYRRRTVIEHANAWIDSFKALLVRYETSTRNWMSMHWMAFCALFLRKIKKIDKV
jgi:transposase